MTLTADLSSLTASERQMLGLFIDAGAIMDDLFWRQTYGDRDALLKGITDPRTREFVRLNYGPWDRLAGNAPFVPGVGRQAGGRAVLSARHDARGIREGEPAAVAQRIHAAAA